MIAYIDNNGKVIYRDATPEELAQMEQEEVIESDWLHNYPMRIVAPRSLTIHDVGIAMFVHFSIEGLPIVKIGDDLIHIYCNEIMPQHQELIEQFQGIITIENRDE